MSYSLQRVIVSAWEVYDETCDAAYAKTHTDAAVKVYDETRAAAWKVYEETVISQSLEQLTTLQQFKELVEWAEKHKGVFPPFDQLPDKCKHFYRLMKLEGK